MCAQKYYTTKDEHNITFEEPKSAQYRGETFDPFYPFRGLTTHMCY